jgi:DNA-binding winged helix-turn-helix (wHTH) protein/tetratricopeptide (TPR) repeat protein
MRGIGKNIYEFNHFRLDMVERRLFRDGQPIILLPKVFDLLAILVERRGQLITKEELREHLWPRQYVAENNLTVRMSALRKALGEQHDEHLYIETVTGEGYRFVARVREIGEEVVEEGLMATHELSGIRSLAVIPLINESADQNLEYLSDGITESIINSLSQIKQLRVMARNTVFSFKGSNSNPIEAGLRLGVDAVVAGRLLCLEGQLIVCIELADVLDKTQVWGETYRQPFSNILEMQERIAKEISEKLILKLTKEEKRLLNKQPTAHNEAFRLYMKGRYFWNKRTIKGINKGIQYFEEAIKLDENYALAYVGLSDCYEGLAVWNVIPRNEVDALAKGYVTKAMEIDGSLAEAYAALANIELHSCNWPAAEMSIKSAIRLNPNNADAHQRHSIYLTAMGRFDEALAAAKVAQNTDPFSFVMSTQLGVIYHFMGRNEEAIKYCDEVIEMDPGFAIAYGIKGIICAQIGRYEKAIAMLKKTDQLLGGDTEARALLGYAYGMWGKRVEALNVVQDLLSQAKHKYIPPILLSYVYLGLKEKDKAFEWLEKAYRERSYSLMNLKVDPIYDSLRSDLRFTNMLQRLGFSAANKASG